MKLVEVVDCTGADEFLEQLSSRGPLFGGTEAVGSNEHLGDAWVFRGHADDDYSLVPSAMRDADAFSEFGGTSCYDNRSQIEAEMGILRRFFNLADANGLPLPEDSQTLRASIRELFANTYFEKLESGEEVWPPMSLWSLLAISQHYGVPTRLLDWTRKGQIASYFAASGALRKLYNFDRLARVGELDNKKLSVWAFRFDKFTSYFDKQRVRLFAKPHVDLPLVKVTAPHANNRNLHAQDGLFSLQLQDMEKKLDKTVDRSPLEQFIERFCKENQMDHVGLLFYRIRLPWEDAGHLRWRLQQEGIGMATIYPGYNGVVGALKEESAFF